MFDQIINYLGDACMIFFCVGCFSVCTFNLLSPLLSFVIQPADLLPHDSFITSESSTFNSIFYNFALKEDVIKFIAFNFIDYFFKLSIESIEVHYNSIINNERLYTLLKGVFSDKDVCLKSISTIKDVYFRGQMLDFFYKLNDCQNFDQFQLIYKNKKMISHLIQYIKSEYSL